MEHAHEDRLVSVPHAPGVSDQSPHGQELPRWRQPVVRRLSVERTLFFVNSPTDMGSNGSTIG